MNNELTPEETQKAINVALRLLEEDRDQTLVTIDPNGPVTPAEDGNGYFVQAYVWIPRDSVKST